MAILIVDDETSTRTALRELLTQIGHKTVLEAKNGEEALKVAETEKSRIRMIVADWEMPYMDGITLLDRVAGLPELDLAPFLLITSDLPRARLSELQARTDRLDGFLIKPFRMNALSQAMQSAQAHRASVRRNVVVFDEVPSSNVARALSSPACAKNWNAPVVASTLGALQEAVASHSRRLGAIVVRPSKPPTPGLAEWLTSFGRTPLGTQTPVLCASRSPEAIFPLRTLCEEFVAEHSDDESWAARLDRLRKRMASSLELELLFQELKAELQQKNASEAQKLCRKILALDETNAEAHASLGDQLDGQGKRADAIAHYRKALESNPCLPRPYIRLLESAASASDRKLQAESAEEAVVYCPQNQDVLLAAAQSWSAQGQTARAQELARRILALNPQHAGARALLPDT
jgi:two-component system chemotaxis response regulator CheY